MSNNPWDRLSNLKYNYKKEVDTNLNSNISSPFKKYSLYERRWEVIVTPRTSFTGSDERGAVYNEDDAIVVSNSLYGEAALHCKFNVTSSQAVPTYGDITIYNLNERTVSRITKEGARVVVMAGYKNGNYGMVWNGNLFSFMEYRENVTDKVLLLHCMQGKDVIAPTFVIGTLTEKTGKTMKDRVSYLTRQMNVGLYENDTLRNEKAELTKPFILFGDYEKYLRDEAKTYGCQRTVTKDNKYCISNIITEVKPDEEIVISPSSGLIGIPTQVPKGISFRTLLDPRLLFDIPPMQIRIDNSEIKAMPMMYGSVPEWLDEYGRYKVISVTHTGDTRGQEWYSDVEAWVNPDQLADRGVAVNYNNPVSRLTANSSN